MGPMPYVTRLAHFFSGTVCVYLVVGVVVVVAMLRLAVAYWLLCDRLCATEQSRF